MPTHDDETEAAINAVTYAHRSAAYALNQLQSVKNNFCGDALAIERLHRAYQSLHEAMQWARAAHNSCCKISERGL